MISYAQNFEDVILWRALRNIPNGTYVDVGAYHPDQDSVTKWFYDCGWSGVNIEPLQQPFQAFAGMRVRDINLNCLVGKRECTSTIYEIDNTGLSTAVKDIASKHAASGYSVRPRQIMQFTLTAICTDHLLGKDIHFLKVDVEGSELEVLTGLDLELFRPWIIVVEAVDPVTRLRSDAAVIELLSDNNYQFSWFDGLNSFFVAEEHSDLKELVALPPNVFDEFTLRVELSQLRNKMIEEFEARLPSLLLKHIPDIKPELTQIAHTVAAVQAQVEDIGSKIEKSREWIGKNIERNIRKRYLQVSDQTRLLCRKVGEKYFKQRNK